MWNTFQHGHTCARLPENADSVEEKAHRVLGLPYFLVLLVLQLCNRNSLKLGAWILVMGGGHLENTVTLGDPKFFSGGFPGSVKSLQLCLTVCYPWTVPRQAPLSMGFSRQEYCSGLPFPPPGDLPDAGIKPVSLASPELAGGFFTTSANWEAHVVLHSILIEGLGNSLVIQWLGPCAFTADGPGLIPGRGTKIPLATWCS